MRQYSKSPTYKHSSWKLSKMQMCVWMRSPKRSSATQWPSARSWEEICKRTTSLNSLPGNTRSLLMKPDGIGGPEKGWGNTRGRSNWRTEEMFDAGDRKGIFLFAEALLVLRRRTQNAELYISAAAAVQNAIQCYHVICDKKKGLLPKHHWITFSRG